MPAKQNPKSEAGLSLTDMAKRIIYASIGSASLAKKVVTSPDIQKELIATVLSKAEQTKDDIMGVLAAEVSKFLGKVNIAEEVTRSLKGLVINFQASVDFDERKKSPSVKVHSAKARRKSR